MGIDGAEMTTQKSLKLEMHKEIIREARELGVHAEVVLTEKGPRVSVRVVDERPVCDRTLGYDSVVTKGVYCHSLDELYEFLGYKSVEKEKQ